MHIKNLITCCQKDFAIIIHMFYKLLHCRIPNNRMSFFSKI